MDSLVHTKEALEAELTSSRQEKEGLENELTQVIEESVRLE